MPMYTYRREDGTTFDYKQSFADAPLTVDPQTGQPVVRVVQAAGIIFKGSGFYVNDSKNAAKTTLGKSNGHSSNGHGESNGSTSSESTSTTSGDSSSSGTSEKAAATTESKATVSTSAAAD